MSADAAGARPATGGPDEGLWRGLREAARQSLGQRRYAEPSAGERLASVGLPASKAIDAASSELADAWIPGVELVPRRVFHQFGRGHFSELARVGEGRLAEIGLLPAQWSAALMVAGSAKGFHVHPPFVPGGSDPIAWFKRLFREESDNYQLRPYHLEQWDVMSFVQGRAEVVLVDEREGLPRRVMRLVIDGDDLPGPDNAAVVIPPGVAHAIRSVNSRDLITVYGTSTVFNPDWEGRIASGVESVELPDDWQRYLTGGGE